MKKTLFFLLISFLTEIVIASDVNIYTSRHYDSDEAEVLSDKKIHLKNT